MLTKVLSIGKSFRRSCQYLSQDQERSRVLRVEGVRGHNYKLMADDFEEQRQMRPGREKPVLHLCLSFSPLEQPPDAQMVEIARKYMERIGMVDTQYAIVKHIDRAHAHMHILINVVNNQGKSLDLGWIRLRTFKAARELTEEYKLIPTNKKNLHLTHKENMRASDARRYRIYEAIMNNLPACRSLEDLEKRLLFQGISVQYRIDKNTRQKIGVSFKMEKECFAGGKIDQECRIKPLQERLEQQQQKEQQELTEQQELQQQQSHLSRHHL